MVYTSYEMIRDCRAGKPEGWSYFAEQYAGVMRQVLAHYFPERAGDQALMERLLIRLQAGLFASLEPAPERAFVAALRQWLLSEVEANAGPDSEIGLAGLSAALQPLTLTGKLAVWLETMRYTAGDAGRMLRMSPPTVEQIRAQAAELIRGSLDTWSRTLLADQGRLLGQAAAAASTPECLPAKAFFDVIDGRATWSGREDLERHVKDCWHCLDHFCRLLEVVDVLRTPGGADPDDVERYKRLLGIATKKAPFWKRA